MKHLIFAVLLLAACSKPNITTYETKEVFYKLQEVDKDGKVIESPIRSTNVTIASRDGDDEDDDDHDHNPVPIKLETFVVVRLNSNTIKVYWEATNEDGVSHYNILKSFDSKVWNNQVRLEKGEGKYTYIDKF
jgi:major membrane immunogen (membrane-anchored lipoprotein)